MSDGLMRHWLMLAVFTLWPGLNVLAQPTEILPEQIWIFDTHAQPVHYAALAQTHPIRHFNLDQVNDFEQQFSLGLSLNPQVANQQAIERIQKLTPAQRERFRQGYTGIVTAFQKGVKQVPAVVFDYQGQSYVVYGQTQAAIALKEFQQWLKNH